MWRSKAVFKALTENTLSLGQKHEKAALRYLKQKGLKLVAQNVRFKAGEIDLIMMDQSQLVFTEVRYRKNKGHGGAAASVTRHKQSKLIKAAQLYLQQEYGNRPPSCRFDVIAIEGNDEIRWIKNAFA